MIRTAVILGGGLGTRLRSVIGESQKVVTEVAGKPFVMHLLQQLAEASVERVVICAGYQAEQVRESLGPRQLGIEIVWSIEPSPLGTGGAVRYAAPLFEDDERLFILNGDSYCHVNLAALEAAHLRREARLTMTLTPQRDTSRFGRVECDSTGLVDTFVEKGKAGEGWINAGVYCVETSVLEELPDGPSSLERELFPRLSAERYVLGYPGGRHFIDIGLPETLALADEHFAPTKEAAGAGSHVVLVDRDGTINRLDGYITEPSQLELLPGAAEALRVLREAGVRCLVVTNQANVGRGVLAPEKLDEIHDVLLQKLAAERSGVDGFYVCPHAPEEECDCRKPRVGLAQRASAEHGFVPENTFVVGDNVGDMEFGHAWGATSVMVRTGYGLEHTERAEPFVSTYVEDLWCAATLIEHQVQMAKLRSAG